MVLQNYVLLQPGVPTRLHFSQVARKLKTIGDPDTGRPKQLQSLEFTVDEMNGQAVVSAYSVVSQKHSADFAPFLPGDKFLQYDFIITMTGEGFLRQYQVQTIPHLR